MSGTGVLVVENGASRGALTAVRSLAAAGWRVGVGSPAGRGPASSSRACHRRHRVPAAHEDSAAFLAAVRAAVAGSRYEVVFGAGEAEVLALSAARDTVGAVVPYAEHAQVVRAIDKQELCAAARQAGLRTARALDPDGLTGERQPVVVKARLHARPERPGSPPRIDTLVVHGAEAARRRIGEVRGLGGEPLVEEFHRGTLMAYAAVIAPGGRVVADCMQVASRIWPPEAGASCRAETVPVDPAVSGPAARLLTGLGWYGLAQLQFVVPDDGVPRLIDLNGRFYGSMALAVAAGADLPAAWAALATGRDVPFTRARPGVRYQWLEGDLRRAAGERRGGLITDLAGTLRHALGAAHSTLSLRDPRPSLSRLRHLPGNPGPAPARRARPS